VVSTHDYTMTTLNEAETHNLQADVFHIAKHQMATPLAEYAAPFCPEAPKAVQRRLSNLNNVQKGQRMMTSFFAPARAAGGAELLLGKAKVCPAMDVELTDSEEAEEAEDHLD
jgi:hypothetical protein